VSNVETDPVELTCYSTTGAGPVEVLEPRDVPLGGPRAMAVRRTLPQRARSLIGAWCFADHYGPDSGPMDVAPHPHTGLQTVSWLFAGEIEHRDSLGTHAIVRPGEMNLMTGGHGICHSEVSTPGTTLLHGVQLWVALPKVHSDTPRDFQHHVPVPFDIQGATARVFLGTLGGTTSPVRTFTPLLGAELIIDTRVTLDLNESFEHGVLVDTGSVDVAGTLISKGKLGYLGTGARSLTLESDSPSRVILLGGEPFGEEIVMWWNFVGRSHEDIVRFRADWQAETERFGRVEGYHGDRLPAPPMPIGRLRPRR